MTEQIKELVKQLETLPRQKQEEIVNLVLNELNWDRTFEATQEHLATLARQATKDYKA